MTKETAVRRPEPRRMLAALLAAVLAGVAAGCTREGGMYQGGGDSSPRYVKSVKEIAP